MTFVTLHTLSDDSVYTAFTAAQGQSGSHKHMQMPLVRSALGRGVQRVAGMLAAKAGFHLKPAQKPTTEFQLVSWASEARSRREDELARLRASEAGREADWVAAER